MTLNDAADRVNSNAIMAALAKVGMFLTPILLTIFLFVASNWLNAYNARMDKAETSLEMLSSRLGAVETRSAVLGPQRDQFQRDAQQTFKDINAGLSIILQQQSAILARLSQLDRTGK